MKTKQMLSVVKRHSSCTVNNKLFWDDEMFDIQRLSVLCLCWSTVTSLTHIHHAHMPCVRSLLRYVSKVMPGYMVVESTCNTPKRMPKVDWRW